MSNYHKTNQLLNSKESSDVFSRDGVQKTVLRKLKKGAFPVLVEIDLHGLTVNEALTLVEHEINSIRNERITCVSIIHGKGLGSPGKKSKLKPTVLNYLRTDHRVLAFCPAARNRGGSGATFVLLRRKEIK